MAHLQLAVLLTIAVSCVIVATRPVEPRRRSTIAVTQPRARRSRPAGAAITTQPAASHRNRWDRADILRAVGRDYADPDAGLTAWPAPSGAATVRGN